MAEPQYGVDIEFVSGSYTSVTSDVVRAGISRSVATAFESLGAGRLDLVLDNAFAVYSPENTLSPFAGFLKPNKRVRIRGLSQNILPSSTADASDTASYVFGGSLTMAIVSGTSQWGHTSLVASRNSLLGTDVHVGVRPTVQAGTYTFTVYVSAPPGEDFLHATAVVGSASEVSSYATGTGTWQRVIHNRTFSGSMQAQHFVRLNSASAVYRMDSWQVESNTTASPWMEGDSKIYDLFAGFVDGFTVSPEPSRKVVHIQASDRTKDLLRRRVDMPLAVDTNAGSLISDVLSYAGVPVADRSVDPLYDTIPFAWFEQTEAGRALQEILRFGNYYAYVSPNGTVNIKDRNALVYGTATASYVNEFLGFNYTLDDAALANAITVEGTPRHISPVQTIAWLDISSYGPSAEGPGDDVPQVPATGRLGVTLQYLDPDTREANTPATSMVTPISSSDYRGVAFTLESSLDPGTGIYNTVWNEVERTAQLSVQITFGGVSAVATFYNASSNHVYLKKFQLRGAPIVRDPEFRAFTEDNSSQLAYGRRDLEFSSELIGTGFYAEDYAEFLRSERREPLPQVSFSLKNVFPDVLGRELHQLVWLVESNTAVGSLWAITGVEHHITLERGLEHTATYTVEFARLPGMQWLVLDHPTLGKLSQNRLGF